MTTPNSNLNFLGLLLLNVWLCSANMEMRCSRAMCYQYISVPSTWQQAASHCSQLNTRLATITSDEEQRFLEEWLIGGGISPDIWIGAKEVDTDWLWIHGNEWNFTAFGNTEPDNDVNSLYEVCLQAVAANDYRWADMQCWLKARYICSFDVWSIDDCVGLYYNERCWTLSNDSVSWFRARYICSLYKAGDLAAFYDDSVNQIMSQYFLAFAGGDNVWLGGASRLWVWWQTGQDVIYTNWRSYYPANSNGRMSCVALSREVMGNLYWVTRSCATKYHYICQSENSRMYEEEQSTPLAISSTHDSSFSTADQLVEGNSASIQPKNKLLYAVLGVMLIVVVVVVLVGIMRIAMRRNNSKAKRKSVDRIISQKHVRLNPAYLIDEPQDSHESSGVAAVKFDIDNHTRKYSFGDKSNDDTGKHRKAKQNSPKLQVKRVSVSKREEVPAISNMDVDGIVMLTADLDLDDENLADIPVLPRKLITDSMML